MDSCRATPGQLAGAAIQRLGMDATGYLADHGNWLGITHGGGWDITPMAHRGDCMASASFGGLPDRRTRSPPTTPPLPWTD